jgi:hypothetical protein
MMVTHASGLASRTLLFFILVATALALGGCGGGGDGGERRSGFINFTNAPGGEIVLDVDNDIFRVTEREGCLWSDEYGFVTDWCLVGSGNRLDFGGSYVVLVSHPGRSGGCVTVLADERTLLIVDIYINANGFMDYAISNVPALRC